MADIIFTTSTLPKVMDILLTRINRISFMECFSQLCFYMLALNTEDLLLSFMSYDRYVAICKPLYYHMIMRKRNYILFLMGIWMLAFGNALLFILSIYPIDICYTNKLPFFCEIKSLSRILCTNTQLNIILIIETIVFGVCLFLFNLTSYSKIISVVLSIPSKTGRKKTFSTCTSHLTVLSMFYGAGICLYLIPSSEQMEATDLVFSTLFVALMPMFNPIIYSLRNKEVKSAIRKIIHLQ
ncbi:olfactory receptor 1G1-like [Engystomops pustulosus]